MSEQPVTERADLVDRLRLDRRSSAPAARRARRVPVAAVTVAAVIALAALWAVFSRTETAAVRTAAARSASEMPADASVLDASGYVVARLEATVSAKITGKVIEVRIDEGMRVEKGEVLARLDPAEAQAQLALARAEVAAARAELAVLRADLAQADRDLARQDRLVRSGSTSTQEAERARSLRDTLRARIGRTEEQVHVAEEQVGVAQVQLDNTEVRAPFSGVVVEKAAMPGEMISPVSAGGGFTRTGIGTIVDMDSLEIEVDVNESFIGRVFPDQPVHATLNAYPEWKIPGHVIAVIPTADRSKATIKVRVAIDTKDPRIVPEMGVRVAFLASGDQKKKAATGVWVPGDAVRTTDGKASVFVVDGGRAHRREVTTGDANQTDRQIVRGVEAGERVVVSPPADLEDGDAVRLADEG
jgi:RND family efflux transporter MFP subunit